MKKIVLLLILASLSACASLVEDKDERLKTPSEGRLADVPLPAVETDIPPVVQQAPIIAAPEPAANAQPGDEPVELVLGQISATTSD